nr:Galacturonosyltransferase 12 [Ipomoea batatas]
MTGNVEREKEDPNPTTRPLRNFTLPSSLKCGHQKHLCCMKLDNSSGDHTEEDDDSNRAQVIRNASVGRSLTILRVITTRRKTKLIDLRAAAVHTGERERLDVVNNGDKKPFVDDEDSNPAAACPWTLRTRPAGERNGKVVNLAQL